MKSYDEYASGFDQDLGARGNLIGLFGTRELALDYWVSIRFFKDAGIDDPLAGGEEARRKLQVALKGYSMLEKARFCDSIDRAMYRIEEALHAFNGR